MATIETAVPVTENELNAHEVRITSHGKMNAWVDFALKFFEENPDKPLTLHTLPPPPRVPQGVPDAPVPAPAEKEKEKEKLHPSMALIPRLISVVEIIKREYVKLLDPVLAERGQLAGLYQYNELGELDLAHAAHAGEDAEEARRRELAAMLQGKNHLKIKKVAYMKVTLSRKELSHTLRKTQTYQRPAVRKLSKSARSRAKKRLAKESDAQDKP
ncbi:hypothetical protein PsYK624_085300 [Phanerochaete sordida]|uniref:Uncharacterized protein n=1 Tax=Phanerochaete sordida TaxID=48140 RepID=A0A9P3GCH9_9APHY|nr:hypothetical protein PsYK624_085300 [Phanerochaete sordida]